MRKYILSICLTFALLPLHLLSAQPQYAKNGMVVSDHKLASDVGTMILKKGGNAVDAAVATAFALAVTHPQAGNIGGGGFMVYVPSNGEATTFDFREKAPLAASKDMYLDSDGNLIAGSNHNTLKAVGVPGTVAGLYDAHKKYGKLEWAELVQPAIDLAKDGFELSFTLAQHAKRFREENKPFLNHFYDQPNGELTQMGQKWKQPALTKTLRAIRNFGKDGFYKGWVADEIESYMQENCGIITKEDLSKYEAIERKPIRSSYKDYTIYSMPPPSSGGVAIVEMMNLMEQADFKTKSFNSADYFHFVAESMRRAFADRAEHLGDPDFNPEMPVDKLISKNFAKSRFENIDWHKASISDSSQFGQLYDGRNTTHFSVIDKDHNAVSVTYTLEYSYGVGLGSEKLGFIFNNEMGDFNPQPGLTTSRGLIGSEPNQIQPEKRMLSSMSPTIVTKDGIAYLVIGSPGGRTIINTVFQTVLAVLEFDMPIDKAIESAKIHHQWLPDRILYEADKLSPDTIEKLSKMGHKMIPTYRLGRLMGIVYDAENDIFTGASDSSSPDGGVSGY